MVDISEEALAVSKENLRRNHQNRTICLKADALEKPPMGIGTFDLIVSNPPYVASMDILTLDSSVRDYEPLGALDGGEDGLMFYRAIVRHWTQILRPGGWLMGHRFLSSYLRLFRMRKRPEMLCVSGPVQGTPVFEWALTALQCFLSGAALLITPAMVIGRMIGVSSDSGIVSFLVEKLPETGVGKALSSAATNSLLLVFVIMMCESQFGPLASYISLAPTLVNLLAPLILMLGAYRILFKTMLK